MHWHLKESIIMTILFFPILWEQLEYKKSYNNYKSNNHDIANDIKLIVFSSFHVILFSV